MLDPSRKHCCETEKGVLVTTLRSSSRAACVSSAAYLFRVEFVIPERWKNCLSKKSSKSSILSSVTLPTLIRAALTIAL